MGHPDLRVAGKIFIGLRSEGGNLVSLKSTAMNVDALVREDPETYRDAWGGKWLGVKLDRVTCCWDGGRTAARAINDALPLLKKAGVVELFILENDKTRYEHEVQGVDLARHLARHGVNVEVETLPVADIDVGNAILSHAADRSVDMIVMGGYGHSRFREFVLGGTTREILATMTVPVFMSH